jgi:hypothetical protein
LNIPRKEESNDLILSSCKYLRKEKERKKRKERTEREREEERSGCAIGVRKLQY